MPYRVLEFCETPNPNAMKLLLDRPTGANGAAPRSFFRAADATSDPLARALFEIPGVSNVLIQPDWITVGKTPDAKWDTVKAALVRTLGGAV